MTMLRQVRRHATTVELITNGMLLREDSARELIDGGLDVLWVSIRRLPESYADVRLGAALQQVIDNVTRLRDMRARRPSIGIVFVAMKKNISELPEVLKIGRRVGADRFLITNVMPYTADLQNEMLYRFSLGEYSVEEPSCFAPHISMMPIT